MPTALVTGASGGIGADLARVFAKNGHDLVLVARSRDKLEELAASLTGVRSRVIVADLGDPASPSRVAEEAGSIDVLVNNAGFGLRGAFATETSGARELEMIQLNIGALTHLTKLFVPGMVERKSGRVLNVASTAAFLPGPFMAVYYATKAYVVSFSQALSEELDGTGVTVTALCPGPTRTGFVEAAAMGSTPLFSSPAVMDSPEVAEAAFAACVAGQRMVIPGVLNWIGAASSGWAPMSVTAKLARRLNGGG